ncbi:hypothetical protein [Kangiella sp. TOML190]|uniref:hypothetical protein n=1 Tax=Kangiella sp. TOML190 TaxID=2931351 RepID=UPI00203F23FB|nr:hypothetical protein [Kangiella sp. TOML190]
MKKIILAALPLIAVGCATTNEPVTVAKNENVTVATAKNAEAEETTEAKQKLKCVYSRATGSQMRKKRCWTKEQYKEIQEQSRDTLRRAAEAGTFHPVPPEN